MILFYEIKRVFHLNIVLSFLDCDDEFFEQCLSICMLDKEKFLPFLSFIEELIRIEIFQYYDVNGFFKFIMTKILELNHIEHLQHFLDHLLQSSHESELQHFFRKFLQVNSEFLLKACAQENMEMVKVFIKYNCHLTITHEDKENVNWRSDLNPLGFDIIPTENNQNLKVLDMMATKAYIFGSYQAMLEMKGIQDCICEEISVEVTQPTDGTLFFHAILQSQPNYHHCPASEGFLPDFMDCTDHVECNDPISR